MTPDPLTRAFLLGLQACNQITDDYEALALTHELIHVLKDCPDPALKAAVVQSKEFVAMIERGGYLIDANPESEQKRTKGCWFKWLVARTAKMK